MLGDIELSFFKLSSITIIFLHILCLFCPPLYIVFKRQMALPNCHRAKQHITSFFSLLRLPFKSTPMLVFNKENKGTKISVPLLFIYQPSTFQPLDAASTQLQEVTD